MELIKVHDVDDKIQIKEKNPDSEIEENEDFNISYTHHNMVLEPSNPKFLENIKQKISQSNSSRKIPHISNGIIFKIILLPFQKLRGEFFLNDGSR